MGSNRNFQEFRRCIETTFSCCMSTDIRLFSCNILKSIQYLSSRRNRLHMSKYRWISRSRSTVRKCTFSKADYSLFMIHCSRSFFSGHASSIFCKFVHANFYWLHLVQCRWFRLVDYVYSRIVVLAVSWYSRPFASSWSCNTCFLYR